MLMKGKAITAQEHSKFHLEIQISGTTVPSCQHLAISGWVN